MTFDSHVAALTQKNPSMAVPWLLMAAYAYYHQDDPILSDGAYDSLADVVVERWNEITHQHKHLLRREELLCASTLYWLAEADYPRRVVGALRGLRANGVAGSGAGKGAEKAKKPRKQKAPEVAGSAAEEIDLFGGIPSIEDLIGDI